MKAYELYAAGVKKSDIAREMGVTRQCVNRWSKADAWEDRLAGITKKAQEAADMALGDQVAAVVVTLQSKLARRIEQLEYLCSAAEKPATRLQAIQLWFRLAGIKQAIPNPTKPDDAPSLELIQDLIDEEPKSVGNSQRNLATDPR